MWSFESKFQDVKVNGGIWTLSGQRWDTWEQAWEAAGRWAHICFENDMPVDIRLLKVG